jgi:hypothetical protein
VPNSAIRSTSTRTRTWKYTLASYAAGAAVAPVPALISASSRRFISFRGEDGEATAFDGRGNGGGRVRQGWILEVIERPLTSGAGLLQAEVPGDRSQPGEWTRFATELLGLR